MHIWLKSTSISVSTFLSLTQALFVSLVVKKLYSTWLANEIKCTNFSFS